MKEPQKESSPESAVSVRQVDFRVMQYAKELFGKGVNGWVVDYPPESYTRTLHAPKGQRYEREDLAAFLAILHNECGITPSKEPQLKVASIAITISPEQREHLRECGLEEDNAGKLLVPRNTTLAPPPSRPALGQAPDNVVRLCVGPSKSSARVSTPSNPPKTPSPC